MEKSVKNGLDKSYHARNSEINNNKVDLIKTVKYSKNTFIIFLNTIESLHGVTERENFLYEKVLRFNWNYTV